MSRAGAGHASMQPAMPWREELEELMWVPEGAGYATWKSSKAHQVHMDATCVHVLKVLKGIGILRQAGAGHASMQPVVPMMKGSCGDLWVLEGAGHASLESSVVPQVHGDATCIRVLCSPHGKGMAMVLGQGARATWRRGPLR